MTNFDERARDWDSDPKKVERARRVAEAIRRTVPLSRTMKALEYGCGTGLLSFALQSDLGEITLADTSQGMLDVLGEKIDAAGVTNMHPVRLDLVSDPLPAGRYDLSYSLMTLHHIHDVRDILAKFHDLLLPGGVLLVADLDREDGSFDTDGSTDVHKGFDRNELQRVVEETGFDQVVFSTPYEIKKQNGNEAHHRCAAPAADRAGRSCRRSPELMTPELLSILVPVFNESRTVASVIDRLMTVDLPVAREIIVVNDGSTDGTVRRTVERFGFERIEITYEDRIPTSPVRGFYEKRGNLPAGLMRWVLVDKENGGKADALNAGINASPCPFFVSMDADTLIDESALPQAFRMMLSDDAVVAIGGQVALANGCEFREGRITRMGLPNSHLARPIGSLSREWSHVLASLSRRDLQSLELIRAV